MVHLLQSGLSPTTSRPYKMCQCPCSIPVTAYTPFEGTALWPSPPEPGPPYPCASSPPHLPCISSRPQLSSGCCFSSSPASGQHPAPSPSPTYAYLSGSLLDILLCLC